MSSSRTLWVLAVVLTAAALSAPAGARAEDAAVTQRLQSHGGLPGASAKRLVTKLSQRMAKSADNTAQATDPLRVAVSQALFHTSVPPDAMAAAKVRLRLYAGLNEWALGALFTPKPGAIASCVRDTGATTPECEALVAAAGNTNVADARSVAGGPPVGATPAFVPGQNAMAAGSMQGGSRFGGGGSRFGGGAPATATYAAAAPQRPMPARASFGAQPMAAQPMARPQPMAARQQPMSAASQKEAYRLQREAYLARQKQQFEERKQKLEVAAASTPAPDVGASVAKSAPVAAAAPTKSAPMGKPAPAAAAAEAPVAAGADEAPAAEEPASAAKGGGKPALDNDFLDGLLADPLGGKKK